MPLLTGCSSAPRPSTLEVAVTPAPIHTVHPPLPAPVKLDSPAWQECQDEHGNPLVCLTASEAKKAIRNKVAVGRWMGSMGSIVRYYRGLDAPAKGN